jgi:hypothetical protein
MIGEDLLGWLPSPLFLYIYRRKVTISYVIRTTSPIQILFLTPSLNHNLVKLRLYLNASKARYGSGFVKPSACWSLEGMNRISSCLFNTHSLIRWKSISMCFALAWKTWLADNYVAPKLSHHKHGVWFCLTCNSSSKDCTHITSGVTFARYLYSASVLDLDTVACFLELQKISFGPKNTTNPPVDWRSSTQLA